MPTPAWPRSTFTSGAKRVVNGVLGLFGCRLVSNRSFDVFDAMVRRFDRPGFTFVQIGANDGKRFDPIFHYVTRHGWKGYAIEPISEYFEELKRNYARHPQVTCCQVAIYEKDGPLTLHRVDPSASGLPEWSKGIASVFQDHHHKSGTPSDKMIAEQVQGQRLQTFLDTHKISQCDLLQIDTEGYDYHILKMIDFDRWAPKIIRFEHGMTDGIMTSEQFSDVAAILARNGYDFYVGQFDCYAAKRG
jgi:FkbM family methyltransferase